MTTGLITRWMISLCLTGKDHNKWWSDFKMGVTNSKMLMGKITRLE